MKYILNAVTLLAFLALSSCGAGDEIGRGELNSANVESWNKLDANSKLELQSIEKENPDSTLSIVLMLNTEPNEELISEFKDKKVKVITKVGNIITASATPQVIRELIMLEIVKQIEINKKKSIK